MTLRPTIAILAVLAACNGTGPQYGTVHLHLTDLPSADIASAQVWISRAYLVGGGGGSEATEPQFTISDQAQTYDLLTLQNGVTTLLGTATIPVGNYAQLRLVVDSARIVLGGGLTFSDGTSERLLKVPSGMQSGIKVTFGGPIHIAPGETTIVVDFPVEENFVFQGSSASPSDVLFSPTLHATVQ